MNDEKEPGREPANAAPNTSENIEVAREKPSGGWEMPKPVFQQSTGYLPQGFQDRFPDSGPQKADGAPIAASAPAVSPPPQIEISESPDIQPQPELIEDFVAAEPAPPAAPAKKKRSAAVQALLVLFGIFAMAAFAVGFVVLVYYLFFYHPSESQILN
jgi:hypothetical protein